MLTDKIALAIVAAAKAAQIEPAALLAIVEVEADGGRPFEQDGRTPCFLYERHVAWKEATKAGCLPAFRVAGLAIEHWDRATQYKDQGTSANRLALMARAKAIDPEVACASASWGLGQTMGFLCHKLGFASAVEMVEHMTGSVDGQIDCMVREIHTSHLVEPMNAHDWPHVSRIFNGAGYAANHYDTRLASAHARWSRKLETLMPGGQPREEPPEQALSSEEIYMIQKLLRDLGYHEVGSPDGLWGTRTTGALAAFQAHEGLPHTGHYDDATKSALNGARPRPVPADRADAQPGEIGSKTIDHADKLTLWGRLMQILGIGGAGAAGVEQTGWLAQVGPLHDAFEAVRPMLEWAASHWWIGALAAGFGVAYLANQVIASRLADHRSGVHAGPAA